jgi:peptide/nickel transport system substrate-binding protein
MLLIAGLASVAGCSPAPIATNTLIYGRGGETASLDPIHVDTGESVKVIVNIYDTLVTYDDETLDLRPSLATRWETSADGLVWTFHLREGVTFHDGPPLNAEAVKFSLERLALQGHPHVYSSVLPYQPDFQVIQAVDVIDPLTVRFTLREPSAIFLQNLAMFPASIVSPRAVQQRQADFAIQPSGTGPFQFERWVRDQELVLTAFAGHWRGRPKLDRVVFVPVQESAVRLQQLERGEVHLAEDLPPAELRQLEGRPGITIQACQGMNVAYLALNMNRAPLDQRSVREAIWHAIDKRRLIELAYAGHATAAVHPIPPNMWSWNASIADRPFDLERARSLMEQARAAAPLESPVRLDLFVMASPRPYMQQPRETAVFIKEALKPLGIEVRIIVNDINQHFQRMTRGEHGLGLAGWTSDNADPDNFLYQLLDSDCINDFGGNNICRYRSPEVHELLLAGKRELDRDRRRAIYEQAQARIFLDAPMVPLVHTEVRIAQRDTLRGYRLHPSSLVRLRLAYFEDSASE